MPGQCACQRERVRKERKGPAPRGEGRAGEQARRSREEQVVVEEEEVVVEACRSREEEQVGRSWRKMRWTAARLVRQHKQGRHHDGPSPGVASEPSQGLISRPRNRQGSPQALVNRHATQPNQTITGTEEQPSAGRNPSLAPRRSGKTSNSQASSSQW